MVSFDRCFGVRTALIALGSVAFATACEADKRGPSDARSATPPLSMSPANLVRDLCDMNRVQLAPDGSRLFLWTSQRPGQPEGLGKVIVADPACIDDPFCGAVAGGLGRTDFAGWGERSSTLYVRRGEDLLHLDAGDPASLRIESSARLGAPSRVRMVRFGLATTRAASEEAILFDRAYRRAERSGGDGRVDRLEIRPGRRATWLVRSTDQALRLVSDRGSVDLPREIHPRIYGAPMIAQAGAGYAAFQPGWALNATRAPYETTVLDPNGEAIGTFSPRQVALGAAQSRASEAIRSYLGEHPGYVIDDLAVADGDHAVVLLRDVANSTRLVSLRPGSVHEAVCASRSAEDTAGTAWDIDVIRSGDRAIAVNRFNRREADRKLVIYFHGGPAGSLRDEGYLVTVRKYLELGYGVLAVDGTGSRDAGPGAIQALRTQGVDAFREDAAAVAAYVNALRVPPAEIVVHGESFGAAQALLTSQQLGASRLVLVTPWLRHRAPEMLFADTAVSEQIRSQQLWETAIFGDRDAPAARRFRDGLAELSGARPLTATTLVIFAAGDRVSRPEDLSRGDARVVELTNVPHALVLSRPETWRRIAAHLDRQTGGAR
jgi:hypothetical protein